MGTELDVTLRMKERPKALVLDDIRERVRLLPGMNVTIGQPISHRIDHMLSGARANIAVKIFGDDMNLLRAKAEEPVRFDDLEPFVHEGCRVDGDFFPHGPVRVPERILNGNCGKILSL